MRFKQDFTTLSSKGERLRVAMLAECHGHKFVADAFASQIGNAEEFLKKLPAFKDAYQPWYSEAAATVKQILPDRLADFISHYQKPKSRKDITYENYRIEDYLQGLTVTLGYEKKKIVGPKQLFHSAKSSWGY